MNSPKEPIESTRGDYRNRWGHIDWHILILSTKEFVVWIDKEGDLDWETTPSYDDTVATQQRYDGSKHNSMINEAVLLEGTPTEGLSADTALRFKRLIGQAIACSLDQDYRSAARMLAAARQYLRARSEEQSRYWYLTASFATTVPLAVGGLLIWLERPLSEAVLGVDGMWLALACASGAIGALLSVIARSGKLKFDSTAGRRLHYLEGGSRIVAGSIAGLVVALAVKSHVILALPTQGGNLHDVMLVAALAAGAGERLAGSIISKFSSTHGTWDTEGTARKSDENDPS